jgi:hypothetical protein
MECWSTAFGGIRSAFYADAAGLKKVKGQKLKEGADAPVDSS